jgi:hypothetical protein
MAVAMSWVEGKSGWDELSNMVEMHYLNADNHLVLIEDIT